MGNEEFSLGRWEKVQYFKTLYDQNVLLLMLEVHKQGLYETWMVVFDTKAYKEPQTYFIDKSPYHFEFDISHFKNLRNGFYSFAIVKKNTNTPYYSHIRWQGLRIANGFVTFFESYLIATDAVTQLSLSPNTVGYISQEGVALFYSLLGNDPSTLAFKKTFQIIDIESIQSFQHLSLQDVGCFFIKYMTGEKNILIINKDEISHIEIKYEDRGPTDWIVFDDRNTLIILQGTKDQKFESLEVNLYRVDEEKLHILLNLRHILPSQFTSFPEFSFAFENKEQLLEILLHTSLKHVVGNIQSQYLYHLILKPLYQQN